MSDDALLNAAVRDATELRLTTALRAALEQKAAFELEVLNARDHAAAQAAEIGELRHRLLSTTQVHALHDKNHREHIVRLEAALREASKLANQTDGLRHQISAMRSSSTWKIGRVIMLPVRLMKRMLRRG
ncbi:MAG: hypothetical protein ACO32O_05595 [Ilumatobacteraceae bacterium]